MNQLLKSGIQSLLQFFYPLFKRILPFETYAYLAVGAANTIFNIGLFALFYYGFANNNGPVIFGFHLKIIAVELATVFSFLLSVITGFWLNKNFAFTNAPDNKTENRKQFAKYALVALQGQISDYGITKGLILFLGFAPTIAYCLSTVIMLILNFFLQKYYTFREKRNTAN